MTLLEKIDKALKITQRDNHEDMMFVHQVMSDCRAALQPKKIQCENEYRNLIDQFGVAVSRNDDKHSEEYYEKLVQVFRNLSEPKSGSAPLCRDEKIEPGELGLHIELLQHFVDDVFQSNHENEDIVFIRDELNEIKIQYVALHDELGRVREENEALKQTLFDGRHDRF